MILFECREDKCSSLAGIRTKMMEGGGNAKGTDGDAHFKLHHLV
jgi:hypothetical protein